MQCVVLAGGVGSRMRPATDTVPKCLLPVAGRPFVDWQLEWLAGQGMNRIVYSIGYLGDMVRRHVGSGEGFGVEVDYVSEGSRLLGTAGALRFASDQGVLDPTFVVVYGDSYLPVQLAPVLDDYRRRDLPVLMTVFRDPGLLEHPNVVFEDGLVVRYEKGVAHPSPEMRFVDYGLSIWRRDVVEAMVPTGEQVDLDVPLGHLSRSGQLGGYEVSDRFYEIGSPGGLADLEAHLLAGGATAKCQPPGVVSERVSESGPER